MASDLILADLVGIVAAIVLIVADLVVADVTIRKQAKEIKRLKNDLAELRDDGVSDERQA